MNNKWVKGAVSAIVSGAASSAAAIAVDPEHFNWEHLKHLGIVAGIGALVGVLNYIRQSPISEAWDGTERRAREPMV